MKHLYRVSNSKMQLDKVDATDPKECLHCMDYLYYETLEEAKQVLRYILDEKTRVLQVKIDELRCQWKKVEQKIKSF